MTIGVVGAGNVGAALVMEFARRGPRVTIEVCCRSTASAKAAILDASSAFPLSASRLDPVPRLSDDVEVVVVAAGVQHETTLSHTEMLRVNSELALESVEHLRGRKRSFVLVGSPVDEVAQRFALERTDLDPTRVVGFGGALDRCRLISSLHRRRLDVPCTVIGEHGRRAIPVYDGEHDFDAVADEVRSVLQRIRACGDKARNLASGVHLAVLVNALMRQRPTSLCVSTLHEGFDQFLTWPSFVSSGGVVRHDAIELGPRAASSLAALISARGESSHDSRQGLPCGPEPRRTRAGLEDLEVSVPYEDR